jgi:hypothetical protein
MAKMKVEATEIPVTATPEWLASQVVVDGRSNGFADGVVLRCPNDRQVATIPHSKIPFCRPGQELVAVRAWLTQQIEAGYKAGVEAGRAGCVDELRDALGVVGSWDGCLAVARGLVVKDKGQGASNAALCTAVDERFDLRCEVERLKADLADARAEAFAQVLRWCGVDLSDDPAGQDPAFLERAAGDAVVGLRIAKDAPSAPTDAAAESAAIDGLVAEAIRQKGNDLDVHDRSGRWRLHLGDTRVDTRHEVARGWLRPWLLAAWARGVAYGQQPNAPPVLVDSFGVAAREQVAAERAVDAATVAPSEEAIAAAREEGYRAAIDEATAILIDHLGQTRRLAERHQAEVANAEEVAQLRLRLARAEGAAPKETP